MRENELKDAHAYIDKLEQFAATPLAFFDCGYHFRRSPGTTQVRKNSIIENDTTCSVITIARGSVARYLHGSCATGGRGGGIRLFAQHSRHGCHCCVARSLKRMQSPARKIEVHPFPDSSADSRDRCSSGKIRNLQNITIYF